MLAARAGGGAPSSVTARDPGRGRDDPAASTLAVGRPDAAGFGDPDAAGRREPDAGRRDRGRPARRWLPRDRADADREPDTGPSGSPSPTPSPTRPRRRPRSRAHRPRRPSPAAPADDHAPLIVYHYGSSAIDLYTLDAFTGDKTPMGKMQRGAEIAGQRSSGRTTGSRRSSTPTAIRSGARVDIPGRSVQGLVGVPPPVNSDAVSPKGDLHRPPRRQQRHRPPRPERRHGRDAAAPGWHPAVDRHPLDAGRERGAGELMPAVQRYEVRRDPWHIFVAPVDGSPVRDDRQLPAVDYIGVSDISPDGRQPW